MKKKTEKQLNSLFIGLAFIIIKPVLFLLGKKRKIFLTSFLIKLKQYLIKEEQEAFSCTDKMEQNIFEDILQKKITLSNLPKKFKMNNRRIYLYAILVTSDNCKELIETLRSIFLDSLDDFSYLNKSEIDDFKKFITNFLKNEIITAYRLYQDDPMFIDFLETLPLEYRSCINNKINYQLQPILEEKLDKKIQISLSPRVYEKLTKMKNNNKSSYSIIINGMLDDLIE